jgi:hypothetical protein
MNAHTRVTGLSEVHFIQRYFSGNVVNEKNPLETTFWQNVASRWLKKTGRQFHDLDIATPPRHLLRSWTSADFNRYAEENKVFLDCVAEVSGSDVLVDTSKNGTRLVLLARAGIPIKCIHLVRDGRAVVNSYRRKHGNFMAGFRRWVGRTAKGPRTRLFWPKDEFDSMVVRYEDLASDPDRVLRDICSFVSVLFEPTMLDYWLCEDASIGGNRMRHDKRRIRLDEKWGREMPRRHRVAFSVLGGWLNAVYGYPLVSMYRPNGARGHSAE